MNGNGRAFVISPDLSMRLRFSNEPQSEKAKVKRQNEKVEKPSQWQAVMLVGADSSFLPFIFRLSFQGTVS
jgi:hypothetical protein